MHILAVWRYLCGSCEQNATQRASLSVTNYAVVACEIKLFWNNSEIISVFYFICNHVWNRNEIISAAEMISKLFQRHWTCRKYSWAAISLWNNFISHVTTALGTAQVTHLSVWCIQLFVVMSEQCYYYAQWKYRRPWSTTSLQWNYPLL